VVKSLAKAGAPDLSESIVTPEMLRWGGILLTELQDAGADQFYVLSEVYRAMLVRAGLANLNVVISGFSA
jgi:hypothetical protein